MQDILHKEGYLLLITQSNESPEIEKKNVNMLRNNMVDGLIVSTTSQHHSEFYQEIVDSGLPIIFFNRICPDIKAPTVIIDDYKMARLATNHLIEEGYSRIAYLAGPTDFSLSALRKQGVIDALSEHQIPINESLIIDSGLLQSDGEAAMLSLFEKGIIPDALFGFNDPVALGAMKVIKKKGYKIPKDIAVMGFSESKSALLVEPNLTSVAQPLFQIGETVAELMLKRIHNRYIEKQTVYLEAQLNVRESTRRSK
jgi:LacI family transcriptional regulator